MNAAQAILEHVGRVAKIDRDALIAEIERTHDPKVVSSTVSTMLRRGELQETKTGHIVLGDEEVIEKARQERERRKAERDRPQMPPASPTPHVAPVASKPRPGSHKSAVEICAQLQALVDKHGPIRATDLNKHLSEDLGTNLYYHLKAMTERGELLKRGALYGTSPAQFEPRPAADLSAETPTAPIVDVAQVVADAQAESKPLITWSAEKDAPDLVARGYRPLNQKEADEIRAHLRPGSNPPAPKGPKPPPPPNPPDPNARALPNADDRARIKSIADIARKHAPSADEHVLQVGDIYIAVTAPAKVATRVLSAALAVLGVEP